jgi:hypothetical protein
MKDWASAPTESRVDDDPGSVLAELTAEHAELSRRLQAHQEALVCQDLAAARQSFAAFQAALERHLSAEERALLPHYLPSPPPRGGAAELFPAEHARIRQLSARAAAAIGAIADDALTPAAVVSLLDRQHSLKHLLEHHADREHQHLGPVLDATPAAQTLAAACRATFSQGQT